MTEVLSRLKPTGFVRFTELFQPAEGRMGVAVTFLAILELIKETLIEVVQSEPFAPIHIRPATSRLGDSESSQQQVS
jgi:segregation and condensation protein A